MSRVFAYFVFILLMVQPFVSQAKSEVFAKYELQLSQDEVSLLLDGDISFNFSKAALEALSNGLPLGIETEISIRPTSKWYWQRAISAKVHKLEIRYHALSQHYLVRSIGKDYPESFLTQTSALAALGEIEELALIELSRLDPTEVYEVKIQATFDSESLPVPLRPLIYLSDKWRMASDWTYLGWPLEMD